MATLMPQLAVAYAHPGNRRPRGKVVERINWLEFAVQRNGKWRGVYDAP